MIGRAPGLAARVVEAGRALERAGLDTAAAAGDARALARWVLGWDEATWLARARDEAPPDFAASFAAAIFRRAAREPVSQITGVREFYGRPFKVTRDVLTPRPETELVVEAALATEALALDSPAAAGRRPGPVVVDIGTGSGCLAVTLACERPAARIVATDVSSAALVVARENAERLGAAPRVRFREGDLAAGLTDAVDVIVTNPPYIRDAEFDALPPEVRHWEPAAALRGGPDGLAVIRRVVADTTARLVPGGWLVMEIGAGQAEAVTALVDGTAGLEVIRVVTDLQSIPRVVVARRAAAPV